MALSFNDVNKRNTFTWIKMNDDAQSRYFRNVFIQKHGGEFVRKGIYWEWQPKQDQMIVLDSSLAEPADSIDEPQKEPSKTWIFKKEEQIVKTKNIHDFCKEHKLTRSSLYEVMSGKRKHHKGFTFVETTME